MSGLSPQAQYGLQQLSQYNEIFNAHLSKYLDNKELELKALYPNEHIHFVYDVLKDYTLRGGKRVRAALVFFVAKMLGSDTFEKNKMALLDIGIAMELLQTYILIIDDFMDSSSERRGKPTGHLIFADYFEKQQFTGMDKLHFGNSIATNTGLIASHMAFELLNSISLPNEIIIALNLQIHKGIQVTGYGQILDLINSVRFEISEQDIMNVHTWKTAMYTFENPMQCGVIAAGHTKDSELSQTITKFSAPVGLAFQIYDDILGLFGDAQETGKSATGDLEEGKRTLLIQKALENGNNEQKEIIHKYLGKKGITNEEHNIVKKVVEETGSLVYSQELSRKLIAEAQQALIHAKQKDWDQDALDFLLGISSYTIEREK